MPESSEFARLAVLSAQLNEAAGQHESALAQLASLNIRLREAESQRITELAELTHELKKPLGMLRHLAASDPAELEVEIQRACRMLDQIISLAHLELPAEPNEASCDASEFLGLVARAFEMEHADRPLRVELEPSIRIAASAELLAAIAMNALENAAKYSPVGAPIELRLRAVGGEWQLEIRDHGPGIAPDILAAASQPFHSRGQHAASANGHGLGLAIMQRAAKKLGGELEIDSNASGTAIRLHAPLAD